MAQSSSQNENFFNTTQKLLKNRNWTFPVERYFIWRPKFVSNIFWTIIDITELERKRNNSRFLAHHTLTDGDWTKFRIVRNDPKNKIKWTKAIFYDKIFSKELWIVKHRILKPNGSTLKANINEINKCFNKTAEKILLSQPYTKNEFEYF